MILSLPGISNFKVFDHTNVMNESCPVYVLTEDRSRKGSKYINYSYLVYYYINSTSMERERERERERLCDHERFIFL